MPTNRTRCPACREHLASTRGPSPCSVVHDGEAVADASVCVHCEEPVVPPADDRHDDAADFHQPV